MNTSSSLAVGTTLRGGTYRIDRFLGQGGFGITYLATDVALDKRVCIKEFFPKAFCGRDATTSHVTVGTHDAAQLVGRLKAKFIKEARNIAKFKHPNIIEIYAAFEENNTAYYVMEYIEGESLAERVKRSGRLAPEQALSYVRRVGQALEYVHSLSLNHLDVKPANIMVRRADDCPVLIDFGLSKQYDADGRETSTTPVGISHGYAPLEQYTEGSVREFSPTTDEYALAATLYYLLSGVVPPQATILAAEELTFPASVPTAWVPAIGRAMASARRDRFATVGDFLAALSPGSDATELPPPAGPTPTPPPPLSPEPEPSGPPSASRMRWLLIGGIAFVVALVLLWRPWSGPSAADDGATDSTAVPVVEESSDTVQSAAPMVSNMFFHHALGDCSYTGEVDGEGRPHGQGVATWSAGDALSYDGEWSHGAMEGQCTYKLRNGDTFVGSYRADKYSRGRYTVKSTGEYFEGTFKDGAPDAGHWYDKAGNKLD